MKDANERFCECIWLRCTFIFAWIELWKTWNIMYAYCLGFSHDLMPAIIFSNKEARLSFTFCLLTYVNGVWITANKVQMNYNLTSQISYIFNKLKQGRKVIKVINWSLCPTLINIKGARIRYTQLLSFTNAWNDLNE